MMIRAGSKAGFCACALLFSIYAAARAEDFNAAQAFGRLPVLENPLLSPDGRYLAALVPKNGRQSLAVIDLKEAKPLAALSFDKEDYDNIIEVGWYEWANNDRLLVSINAPTKRGPTLTPTVDTRLLSLNADGSDLRLLLRQNRNRFQTQGRDNVISFLPDDPEHILMAFAPNGGEPNVYKVNIYTDRKERIENARQDIWQWHADWHGIVRIGKGFSGREKIRLIARRRAEDNFETILKTNPFETETYTILDFADETHAYVRSSHATNREGIYLFDLVSEEYTQTVFEHDKVDAGRVFFSPKGKPLAITYYDERLEYHDLDKAFGIKRKSIDKVLPNNINQISAMTPDERFWTLYSYSSTNPGDYFYLDTSNNHLQYLGSRYPWLQGMPMGETKAVYFKARDGWTIPAYLTLPPGGQGKKLPFIILPHGGPRARDVEGFDFFAQFLASQGYGVIQPNFRGSTGYGDAFEVAGYGEWGLKMQDDVTDATHWVIEEGYADPKRICIFGASYGGYAALMGAVKEPNLYKCAASLNGVTDMPRLIRDEKEFVGGNFYLQAIKPQDDEVSTRDISPRHNIDKINIPILLVQGDIDRSVVVDHGRTMARALKRAKKDYIYIEQEDGDHSLSYEKNRIEFLQALGDFLATHLATPSSGSAAQ